eukprot:g19279.t1
MEDFDEPHKNYMKEDHDLAMEPFDDFSEPAGSSMDHDQVNQVMDDDPVQAAVDPFGVNDYSEPAASASPFDTEPAASASPFDTDMNSPQADESEPVQQNVEEQEQASNPFDDLVLDFSQPSEQVESEPVQQGMEEVEREGQRTVANEKEEKHTGRIGAAPNGINRTDGKKIIWSSSGNLETEGYTWENFRLGWVQDLAQVYKPGHGNLCKWTCCYGGWDSPPCSVEGPRMDDDPVEQMKHDDACVEGPRMDDDQVEQMMHDDALQAACTPGLPAALSAFEHVASQTESNLDSPQLPDFKPILQLEAKAKAVNRLILELRLLPLSPSESPSDHDPSVDRLNQALSSKKQLNDEWEATAKQFLQQVRTLELPLSTGKHTMPIQDRIVRRCNWLRQSATRLLNGKSEGNVREEKKEEKKKKRKV